MWEIQLNKTISAAGGRWECSPVLPRCWSSIRSSGWCSGWCWTRGSWTPAGTPRTARCSCSRRSCCCTGGSTGWRAASRRRYQQPSTLLRDTAKQQIKSSRFWIFSRRNLSSPGHWAPWWSDWRTWRTPTVWPGTAPSWEYLCDGNHTLSSALLEEIRQD